MGTLDIVYASIMVVSLVISTFRGGIREVFSLAAIVAGFLMAVNFYPLVSDTVLRFTSHENINGFISFLVIFIFTSALISYIGGQLTQIAKKNELGFANVVGGAAMGTFKGLLVCTLLTYALLVFMDSDEPMFKKSYGFPAISNLTALAAPIGPEDFRMQMKEKLDAVRYGLVRQPAGQDKPSGPPHEKNPAKKP